MGGTSDGINKESLKKCLTIALSYYDNPSGFLKKDGIDKAIYDETADEIIRTLCKDKNDSISVEDFINIMTFDSEFPNYSLTG